MKLIFFPPFRLLYRQSSIFFSIPQRLLLNPTTLLFSCDFDNTLLGTIFIFREYKINLIILNIKSISLFRPHSFSVGGNKQTFFLDGVPPSTTTIPGTSKFCCFPHQMRHYRSWLKYWLQMSKSNFWVTFENILSSVQCCSGCTDFVITLEVSIRSGLNRPKIQFVEIKNIFMSWIYY